MPLLQIYRAGSLFTEVSTGGSDTMFNGSLGGMNKITSKFESQQPIKFKKRDYIYHHGHSYFLNRIPKHTKDGKHTYEAVFVGREYTLYNFALRYLNSATFPFYGTASEHLAMILGVANIADSGWTGTAADTVSLLINYDKDSCRTGIQKLAEASKLELAFSDQSVALNAKNTGRVHDLTFTYGMDNGLYSMTKTELEESEFGTRFYGYGGSTNLPQNYRGGALQLITAAGFVDRRISTYGLIEKHVEFPEIFPERTGTVSATSSINEITDSTLDFDLNDVIVDGSARIVFTTGLLRGQEFEIATYTAATKLIKFNINQDEAGGQLPNTTLKPAAGDQYKLINIVLPQSYITNAENRLATALVTHADANQDPPFEFGLEIDPIFLAEQNYQYEINPGDMVQAVEPDMDVSVYLRITEISYPLFEPFAITATIGDKISYSLSVEVIKDITSTKQVVKQITKTSLELQRINSIRRRELQGAIFDTDNYFDTANIKPGSIETSMLAVGVRSQDFSLSVMFKPNYNANPNSISWSEGQLVHFTIADVNKTWDIAPTIKSDLISTTLYYIYAKCAKNGSVGVIVLDPIQRRFNDDPTDYYFLIGIAHTVSNGVRAVSLTYGFTDINGRFITTGRITSADGLTWFDLDTGEISGVIKFRASNGSIQNVTTIATAAQNAVDVSANADAKAVTATATANSANTAAIAAQGKADTAFNNAASSQTAATNAQTSATNANNLLADIANDDLLMPAEKQDVLKEWNIIAGEKPVINAQAITYAITTTSYDSAYNTLNSYITPLLSSMTTNSTISGATFRANFKAYYDAKVALLKAISDKAKQIADAAQTSANTVATNLTALQGSLGALAYDQLVYDAMQRETILVGGYLKTSLINAGQIIVGNNLETLAGAQDKANAAQLAAVNLAAQNTTTQIAGLQIGGRNLLYGGFVNGFWNQSSVGNTDSGQYGRSINVFSLEVGEQYSFSMKNDTIVLTDGLWLTFYNADNSYHSVLLKSVSKFLFTASAPKCTISFNALNYTAFYGGEVLRDALPKLEKGTVDTGWTPAPEDLSADATFKANAAQAAAQAYADAKDILKEVTTKAYADGIVDAEEQTRINQAQANLDAAQLDATNKAEAARVAAVAAAAVDASTKTQNALASANTFAEQVAISKANIAQGAAVSLAETDAQNKANIAYSNAVSASNTYAETKANDASTAAQIAAAADASNKATAAYNNAVSAAQAAQASLTATLKPLAFSDVQQIGSETGITFINNGNIATFSIDAAYIRANVITADYISTLDLVARNLRTNNSNGVRWEVDGDQNAQRFYNDDNFVVIEMDDNSAVESITNGIAVMGPGIRVGPELGDNSTMSAKLVRVKNSSNNKQSYIASTAIYTDGTLDVWGTYANLLGNFQVSQTAININNVQFFADGSRGITNYERVTTGSDITRKYVKGLYIGQGNGFSW